MRPDGATTILADFALVLFGIVLTTAGMERTFSDLKNTKTRLRSKTLTERVALMLKV